MKLPCHNPVPSLLKPAPRASVAAVAAALTVLYAAPAAADQLSELQAQLNALSEKILLLQAAQTQTKDAVEKQAAVVTKQAASTSGKGSFPGSLKIPGTETSVKIGGFIKADYTYDLKQYVGDFPAGWRFTVDPSDMAKKGATRFQIQQSRINVGTETATALGTLKTFVEGDFWGGGNDADRGVMNASLWRIRTAQAELGSWLAGQGTTTFMLPASFPETLDVNSPTGQTLLRQTQLRYTTAIGAAKLNLAVEDPYTDIVGAGAHDTSDRLPDVVARMIYSGPWGTASVQGVGRSLHMDTRTPTGGSLSSKFGWGLGAAGAIKTIGKDDLRFQLNFGDGMGRYNQGAIFMAGGIDPTTGKLVTAKTWGAFLAYRHFWSDDVRSNVAVGESRMKLDPKFYDAGWAASTADGGPSNKLKSFHINTIWSPIKPVDVGLEYIYGARERSVMSTAGGLNGSFQRLQATGKYYF